MTIENEMAALFIYKVNGPHDAPGSLFEEFLVPRMEMSSLNVASSSLRKVLTNSVTQLSLACLPKPGVGRLSL